MFKKLSVRVSLLIMIIITIVMIGFTVFLIKDRSEELEEIIINKGVTSAKIGADIMEDVLTTIIDNGIFTKKEVFNFELVPIELPRKLTQKYKNVSEKQLNSIKRYHYVTTLDSYLDNALVEIEDKFLEDPQVAYAALLDKNSYVPAHNTKFNKPLTGDFLYDRNNGRSKRIYTDKVGLAAVRNKDKDYLKQVYYRDTGEVMWDISAPVFVKGEHWGAFRFGVSMEMTKKAVNELKWKLIVLMSVLLIVLVLVVSQVIAFMMRPLKVLHQGVNKLAKGNLSFKQEKFSNDEIGDLGKAFTKMVNDLKDYIEKLKTTTAAKEKMEGELRIAHEIQMGILPKIFPPYPKVPFFDLKAMLLPARSVGGDLYDFFMIDEDNFCFVIGDVSGKGVPAALLMAVTMTLIKTLAKEVMLPEEIMARVNNEIAKDNESCMFVTTFCGILNVKTGVVIYANAGHNPPLIIRKNKKVEYLKVARGPAVGAVEDVTYQREKIILKPGDTIYMYTDGVTEAFNDRDEEFSEKRLLETVELYRDNNAKDLIRKSLQVVQNFSQGVAQSDDITMLVLKYTGK
ncbi:SpoIIE family protein phosphatase [bacterium]|nr:SpoIIE family protein phosphatase [bacterium]